MAINLINPLFYIDFYKPNVYGMVKEFGTGRMYRFNEDYKWECRNFENISDLNCLAISGDKEEQAMTGWSADSGYNDSWVVRYPDFVNPVASYQFFDGKVYSTSDAATDYIGVLRSSITDLRGNFTFSFRRFNPPYGQGIPTVLSITIPALEQDSVNDSIWYGGYLSLVFPLGRKSTSSYYRYNKPFLHYIRLSDISGIIDWMSDGEVLTEFGSDAATHGTNEFWTFESINDTALFDGTQFLISSSKLSSKKDSQKDDDGKSKYMRYYNKKLYPANQSLWDAYGITYLSDQKYPFISNQGAITTVNFTPIAYNVYNASSWTNKEYKYDIYNSGDFVKESNPYSTLISGESDWDVTVEDYTGVTGRKPKITVTQNSSSYTGYWTDSPDYTVSRPVIWYVAEQNDATHGTPASAKWGSTKGYKTIKSMSYTWNENYKNCSGVITWQPLNFESDTADLLPTPFDGVRILIPYGWDDNAPSALQMVDSSYDIFAWTPPNCNRRTRSGDIRTIGRLQPELIFGSYDYAKLASKKSTIVDVRQAGGMTISEFFSMVANRLGIPASKVYVDTAIASNTIPLDEIPSNPFLDPSDGDDWLSFLSSVESAAKCRICWDKTEQYIIWVDEGKPLWTGDANDISFSLTETNAYDYNIIMDVETTFRSENFRNFLKGKYGSMRGLEEFYEYDNYATRNIATLDDFPIFIGDADLTELEIIEKYYKENRGPRINMPSDYSYGLEISWTMQMRKDLMPDDFVYVNLQRLTKDASIPGVFQIISHNVNIDCTYPNPTGTSTFTAVRVGDLGVAAFMAKFGTGLNVGI